jgi:hypothetical protein
MLEQVKAALDAAASSPWRSDWLEQTYGLRARA